MTPVPYHLPYCILTYSTSDQSLPDHLPEVATLRTLLTCHVDFNAVPRRSFFQLLQHFATDDLEKERLGEFLEDEWAVSGRASYVTLINEEFQEELYDYCFLVKRTIKEVLAEFRSARIPKEYIFDLFPPMRPRLFSIASSAKVRHSLFR